MFNKISYLIKYIKSDTIHVILDNLFLKGYIGFEIVDIICKMS